MSTKQHSNNKTPNDHGDILRYQCLAQPLSEKFSPEADGTHKQRVRDLGNLSLKWDVSIKFSHSGLRDICVRE